LAARGKSYLMSKYGVSDVFAAGLLGNFSGESKFNVNAVNPGDGTDGSDSIGIAQWNGKRARNLKAFAAAQGKPTNDFETQLDFAMHELKTTEAGAGRRLAAARTVEEATAAAVGFERPQGWTPQNPAGAHGWNTRLAAARSIYGAPVTANPTGDTIPAAVDTTAAIPPAAAPPTVTTSGGTFRPTGTDTIRGRAFDEAGTKVYLQQVDSEMRSTTQQVFEKYRDDPAQLEKALGDLKGTLKNDHIFPEIEADYDVGFDRLAGSYLGQARENLARKVEKQQYAAFIERGSQLSTDIARQTANLDPDSPGADSALASSLAALDTYFDSAVRQGIIDPDDAAKAKIGKRNDVAGGFYLAQAEKLDADGIATMRAEMAGDLQDGGVAGLDGDGYADINTRLIAMEDRKRREATKAAGDLAARGSAIAERIAAGYDADPAALTQLELDARSAPNGQQVVDATRRKVSVATAIRDLPPAQSRAYVEDLRKKLGKNPTDEDIETLNFAEKKLDAQDKAIKADPLGYAAETGKIELVPIDASSPEKLAETLNARREQAQDVAGLFDTPVMLYRPDEVSAMKADLKSNSPQKHATVMAQLDYLSTQGDLSEVGHTFGDEAVDQLQDWQARLRYASPEETAMWLKERNDPKWQDRVKPLVSKGETEARKVPFEQVVKQLDDNRLYSAGAPIDADTKRMMMNDFVTIAGERYATTQDANQAQTQAVERMRRIWGVTSVYGTNGGRLMPYPPDEHYPAVGGSKAWLGDELAAVATERGIKLENLSLVADGKTKAAADRGEEPGYLMSVINPETGMDELVTDDQGRVLRHYFDPAAAQKVAVDRAKEERRTQNDPWLVLRADTAIGPFYPPWRPATPEDMAMRAKRIKEIAGEQKSGYADRKRRHEQVRAALRAREKD
ncbi:phage tail tip lysozyme, partial [Mesorhizobium sp. M7A.T.Ca.TU.009.02.1.1]|uniref:phage tail tip lysozyme n=1 Tax=Mesorhizobium sp. M7A.T.Ca.TU.009.02.1.1 TaxID=2496791 RepID=UPI001FDEF0DA